MAYHKPKTNPRHYIVEVRTRESSNIVLSFDVWADYTGLAGLLRSVDLATNEGRVAHAVGLRRKRSKKRP